LAKWWKVKGIRNKEIGMRKDYKNVYQVSRAQEIVHAKEWNVSISRTTNFWQSPLFWEVQI
jgi:hypothetical protein